MLPVLLVTIDTSVADGLHSYAVGHPVFVAVMQTWTDVFGPWTFRAILTVVAGWLWWRGRHRVAVWTFGAAVLSVVLDVGLKAVIGRPRPHWTDPVSTAVGSSFPSGHALTSFVGCGILLALAWPALGRGARWMWSIVAALVSVGTGFTRLALGVHFLSDVLGGWLVAAALVAAMLLVLQRIPSPELRK